MTSCKPSYKALTVCLFAVARCRMLQWNNIEIHWKLYRGKLGDECESLTIIPSALRGELLHANLTPRSNRNLHVRHEHHELLHIAPIPSPNVRLRNADLSRNRWCDAPLVEGSLKVKCLTYGRYWIVAVARSKRSKMRVTDRNRTKSCVFRKFCAPVEKLGSAHLSVKATSLQKCTASLRRKLRRPLHWRSDQQQVHYGAKPVCKRLRGSKDWKIRSIKSWRRWCENQICKSIF